MQGVAFYFGAGAPRKKIPPKRRSPGSIPVVLELMVGVVGFEPTTPYTPCRCPAGLGHTPTHRNYITHGAGAVGHDRIGVVRCQLGVSFHPPIAAFSHLGHNG